MAALSDSEIEARLSELSGWDWREEDISKVFECGDFAGSVEFVSRIVGPANEMNHHPDLEISWDKVRVILFTHSVAGITDADFELARKIDALA